MFLPRDVLYCSWGLLLRLVLRLRHLGGFEIISNVWTVHSFRFSAVGCTVVFVFRGWKSFAAVEFNVLYLF